MSMPPNLFTSAARKPKRLLCAVAIAASINTMVVQPSMPAQGNVIFGANLTTNNACAIIVRQSGTMAQNTAGTQLSSRLPSGQAGIADVFAIFPYQISVDTPPYFSSRPAGGDDNVTFSAWFSGQALNSRGANFPSQPGNNPVTLSRYFSYTRLSVDLEASRPDPFPPGSYSTYAIVRCE